MKNKERNYSTHSTKQIDNRKPHVLNVRFLRIGLLAVLVVLISTVLLLKQENPTQVLGTETSVDSCSWWNIMCLLNNWRLIISQHAQYLPSFEQGTQSSSAVDSRILTVIENIQQNGYNYATNDKSGLLINWRYGTNPLLGNGGKCRISNTTDSCKDPGHDRLTDIRYLHNLLTWKATHPTDVQFDSDISRYTEIVKKEFANGTDERGFIYNEWIDMYKLTNDSWYKDAAQNWATAMDGPYYFHRNIGAIYKNGTRGGQYRPSDVVSEGASLIEAGKYFGNSQWVQDGESAIQFVVSHAYIVPYHTFMGVMDKVLNPDGTVNPNESIYHGQSNHGYGINGNTVKAAGELGDAVYALLQGYQADPNFMLSVNGQSKSMLQLAEEIMNANLLPSSNTLGVWDITNKGYFFGVQFSGNSYQSPGTPTLNNTLKESGRQFVILKAFHLVDLLDNHKYQDMEQKMLQVAMDKAYYTNGHGYLYSTTPDWQPTTQKNGQLGNYVTTEAMGIVVEALFIEEQKPTTPVSVSSNMEATIHPVVEKSKKGKKQKGIQEVPPTTSDTSSDIILPDSVDAANQ